MDITFEFIDLEDRVEAPIWRQIHPICHWGGFLCDDEGSNPPSLDLGQQVWTKVLLFLVDRTISSPT